MKVHQHSAVGKSGLHWRKGPIADQKIVHVVTRNGGNTLRTTHPITQLFSDLNEDTDLHERFKVRHASAFI